MSREELTTREQDILAVSARLFAQNGYPGTAMSQLAEACGLSKPALYHYVPDKAELLARICETHIEKLAQLVRETRAEGLAPEAQLRALVARFLAVYSGARHEHRVLTEDLKFLPEPRQQRIRELEREVVAGFVAALSALKPGLEAAGLAKPVTMLLFGMINWTYTWHRPDGAVSDAQLAEVVAQLLLGGLPAVAA
ncbi:TetR/AcrR family transcriptional regulator [Inhella gelatinilytica]|uniref:TetR family transcriptional regulator n=1 Tax=Inhella gelatinilytica TaxID=2795030 RepID=A0A931ISM9_9BURK|nr:TetR/AcrR family transcriptional regulator [Inhella gelatinilytica]MBH9551965.1 TetR family transcriptional regulator [Inhella gelatinilytica]